MTGSVQVSSKTGQLQALLHRADRGSPIDTVAWATERKRRRMPSTLATATHPPDAQEAGYG
jgi:hypothetical protein